MDELEKLAKIAEAAKTKWRRDILAAAEDWRTAGKLLSPESFGVLMGAIFDRNAEFPRRVAQLPPDPDGKPHNIADHPEIRDLLLAELKEIIEGAGGKL